MITDQITIFFFFGEAERGKGKSTTRNKQK